MKLKTQGSCLTVTWSNSCPLRGAKYLPAGTIVLADSSVYSSGKTLCILYPEFGENLELSVSGPLFSDR